MRLQLRQHARLSGAACPSDSFGGCLASPPCALRSRAKEILAVPFLRGRCLPPDAVSGGEGGGRGEGGYINEAVAAVPRRGSSAKALERKEDLGQGAGALINLPTSSALAQCHPSPHSHRAPPPPTATSKARGVSKGAKEEARSPPATPQPAAALSSNMTRTIFFTVLLLAAQGKPQRGREG